MLRQALVIAIASLSAAACKKQPPQGDLPPAVVPPTTATAQPPANPHAAGMGMGSMAGGPAGAPHGAMPQPTEPKTLESLAGGRVGLGPFSLVVPAGWTAKPTTSSMRAANFILPSSPAGETELIIYYFGADGAGTIEDNFDRWLGQFTQPDGKPSKDVAKTETAKFAGQPATLLSVTGHYAAQSMTGGGDIDKPDQALLAAIIGSPQGPYYFKLVGPKATVEANKAAFRGMLDSLKLR